MQGRVQRIFFDFSIDPIAIHHIPNAHHDTFGQENAIHV